MELWFSDIECFNYDWLFVAKRQSDDAVVAIWNDPDAVEEFLYLNTPVLCGFNYRDYDSYLLKGMLLGWEPEQINHISRTIIEQDDRSLVWALFQGQPWVTLPPIIDLFHDIVPRKGLKAIEGNIGMPIEESSVSFDIDRPLTESEREDVLHYCLHDIDATRQLYDLRYDYVKAKSDLCTIQGIDPLTMLQHTNARIVAEVLGAERLPATMVFREDDVYEIPANIDQSAIPADILEFVNATNGYNCMGERGSIEFMFHGCPTTFALGGIHAAVPCYKETSTDERVILIQDIGSFYPSLIINNGYMSRAVADSSIYKTFYDMRMKAKAEGDKATAEAAKLVLNTTYGTFKDTYNKLFDPMQGTRVCLSGQLYVLDLVDHICSAYPSVQLIQLNTDGWVISCDRNDRAGIDQIVSDWQNRTKFTVETDEVQSIVQANVNNYVMRFTNGKVKTKGGVVARYDGGDFKSNSLTIIDKAVVDYLLDGVPIEKTINDCDDLTRFQIIAGAGQTFQKVVHVESDKPNKVWVEVEVQRVNRVYATTDPHCGGIFKVKMENGVEVGRSKIPLTPEHCVIDNENLLLNSGNLLTTIDRTWYIDLATKKAHEFITRDTKAREQMSETTEPVNELQNSPETDAPKPRKRANKASAGAGAETLPTPNPTFGEKLLALQIAMTEAATGVSFDKAISNISHEYADTQQYKMWLALLCSQHGLVFKFDITYTQYLGIVSPETARTPSYAVQVDGRVHISDASTGETATYGVSGLGVNVQLGFCLGVAQTNALRNFILNNYLLDNMGREGDDVLMNSSETAKAGTGYVPPEQKAAIKSSIQNAKAEESNYATDMFAAVLYDKIQDARKVNPTFGEKMLSEHYNEDGTPKVGENGKSTMLKSTAVAGMTKAEEIIASGETV